MHRNIFELVSKTIRTGKDTIDYSHAFHIVDIANKSVTDQSNIFETIEEIMISSELLDKLNCISLVDFLFKNGSAQLLKSLQSSKSIKKIGVDPVTKDPAVHKALYDLVDSWVEECKKNNVLHKDFVEWVKNIKSYTYKYVMTPETANKFISDFSASYELLKMFNQAIITALNSGAGAEDKTLQEILPNVNEVHQRLIKLLPTMSDEYVKSIINYLIEFCKLYKASYNKFLKKGSFDVDALREIEAQGIPQREQKKPKKKTTKKKNADDLLDLIGTPQMPPPKQSSPQPAQQETSNTDDLLDLLDLLPKRQEPSMPQNSSQHQPQQPPQPQYTSQPPSHKGTQRKNQQKHKRHQKNEGFEFEEDKGSSVSDQQFIDFLSSIHPKPLSK